MLPRDLYEIVHILGIALTMLAFGGVVMHARAGGTWKGAHGERALRVAHHLGLFLILLGGFGMLARIGVAKGGIASFPGWLWAKLALLVLLGGTVRLPYRRPALAWAAFTATALVAAMAAWLALYKPI